MAGLLSQVQALPVPRSHSAAWMKAVKQARVSPALWQNSLFYRANLRLDTEERIEAFGSLLERFDPDFIELKEPVEKKAGALRALLEREVDILNEKAELGIGDLQTAGKLLAAQKVMPELEEDENKKARIEESVQKIRDRIAQIVIEGQKALKVPYENPDNLAEKPAVPAGKSRLQEALAALNKRKIPAAQSYGNLIYTETVERQGLSTPDKVFKYQQTFSLHFFHSSFYQPAGAGTGQYIEIENDLNIFGKHVFRFSTEGNGKLLEAFYVSPDGKTLGQLDRKSRTEAYEHLMFWVRKILSEE